MSDIPPVITASCRRGRVLLAVGLLAAAALAWAPGLTGKAAAGVVDAECLGSFIRTFSPPVTVTTQTVTATSAGEVPAVTSDVRATGEVAVSLVGVDGRCPGAGTLPRLDEIQADLLAHRARAEAEGWLGEIEGIRGLWCVYPL